MKNLSKIRKRAGKLTRERYYLEKENLAMRDMKKGSFIEHYKKCGNKNCVCMEGKLHGPYWYLSYRQEGKAVLEYVSAKDLMRTKRLAGSYKKFQSNITKIVRMNKEIIKLMGEMREILIEKRRKK